MKKTTLVKCFVEIILVIMCTIILASWILLLAPQLAGADHSYIIVGKSMEPFVKLGDIALVKEKPPQELEPGDVIVIDDGIRKYAHRIIEKNEEDGKLLFRTKGDYNEAPDYTPVSSEHVIGEVEYVIPTSIIRTKVGYIIFIAMPLMVLAINQTIKVYRLSTASHRKRRTRRKVELFDTVSALCLTLIVANFAFALAPAYAPAGTILLDREATPAMRVKAATWKVPSSLTCHVNATEIQLGEAVKICGRLDPPKKGEEIHLTYSMNETIINTCTLTNYDGSYQSIFQPPEPGTWKIEASWAGNEWYYASSCKLSIHVLGE